MTTAFISHPDTLLHVMDGSHPESPARITTIKNAVIASPLKDELLFADAPIAHKADLLRVHAATYVDYIFGIAPKAGLVRLDGDTSMGPMSLAATLHATGAVIHATFQKSPTTIGNNVSIGHNAIVHGCTIHDNVLVGMGSIIMDDCVVESNSIIAAGAVVTKNTRVEAGSIYAGVPAKKVKDISPELISGEIDRIADNYVEYSSWFQE